MKNLLTSALSGALFSVTVSAQAPLLYEGPYEQGEATYQYIEDNMQQRVFNGKFTYTEVRNMPRRGGDQEILVTGNYKQDKKHLAWAVTVKSTEAGKGLTETIIGNYIDGEKSGLWTHRIRNNENDEEVKFTQATFLKNHFRGPFKMKYQNADAEVYPLMDIKGSFNENGKLDGTWVLNYTDAQANTFRDSLIFTHGVLAFRSMQNITSGESLETFDNQEKVRSFFSNMHPVDSSATINDEKFGIRSANLEHPIIKEVVDTWTNLQKVDLGLGYNASIPTMIVRRGELKDLNRMKLRAELIPWSETPKGKRELEERLAIEKAYEQKIKVADLQFEQENWQQAVLLYQEAIAIKREEKYPEEQIAFAREQIRIAQEKMNLITVVNNRHKLMEGNDKMLRAETYYGKKDKLFEAAIIALDHQKSSFNKTHGKIIAFIDRKTYDEFTLEELKAFQTAVEENIAFQEKLKSISKQEDTKDLEKELKKLESPQAIINVIMR